MRLTWVVMGVVVTAAVVAFLAGGGGEEAVPDAPDMKGSIAPKNAPTKPALQRQGASRKGAASPKTADPLDRQAKALLGKLAAAQAEGDARKAERIEKTLRTKAWDTPSARKYAVRQGWNVLAESRKHRGLPALRMKDKARRLLSRGVFLDDMFTSQGGSTAERIKLIQAIKKINRQVMTYTPGVPGVTEPYKVPSGVAPVQIVSRRKLRTGHNALLMWNHGGNLDPKRIRSGETLLLPLEELTVRVFLDRRRLGIFIADWFVKDFRVGVGREDKPTPVGLFRVHSKHENPDWWMPGGKKLPYGHPKNELGSAWIAIHSDEWTKDAGYGIHGTNAPRTVGTACSNGCVRLKNSEASEVFWWVRTGSAGGEATKIFIE